MPVGSNEKKIIFKNSQPSLGVQRVKARGSWACISVAEIAAQVVDSEASRTEFLRIPACAADRVGSRGADRNIGSTADVNVGR